MGDIYNHFNGEIVYYGYHVLHDWKGISSNIKGFIEYNRNTNKFKCDLKVPVQSFDSKNGNRDANMLIYTNALEHPDIKFTSNSITFNRKKATVDGLLYFGGVKKKISSEVDVDFSRNLKFSGQILINLSDSDFEINSGDRIAQMVISKHEAISWKIVDKLDESKRGDKGFGSTGV